MIETFEKFITLVKKLDDYCILNQSKEYAVIGTAIVIRDDTPKQNHLSFSTYIPANNIYHEYDKLVPVFFLVRISEKEKDISKFLKKNKLDILDIIDKKCIGNLDMVKGLLDDFVICNYGPVKPVERS
jgi:hypothetical protein